MTYVPPIAVVGKPLLPLLSFVEEEFVVVSEGDGVGVSGLEESVGSVITTHKTQHKHTINLFHICQIVNALNILVVEKDVTATFIRVYVSLWGDSSMPLGGELVQVGLTNISCSPLIVPLTVTIDPDSVDEIHLGDHSI